MTDENRVANALEELEKARTALRASRALAGLALWDDAVSRAYYAAFHAASAALLSVGVQAGTHRGVHDLFFEHFVRPGTFDRGVAKDFAALQRYRDDADYGRGARFDDITGTEEVERAASFVARIEAHLRVAGIPV